MTTLELENNLEEVISGYGNKATDAPPPEAS